MDERDKFDDPLEEVDPIMVDAFSANEPEDDVLEKTQDIPSNIDFPVAAEVQPEPNPVATATRTPISDVEFPEISMPHQGIAVESGLFSNIPVQVSVELGRSTVSLKEIFELTEGSIIELDRLVGEPLDLVVNGQVVAKGEVVAIDNNFGLRITSIVSKPKS
tara:strand:- start:2499 stop:2984 length:486 start_codon:yes stop_codon:yes gene_type:complete